MASQKPLLLFDFYKTWKLDSNYSKRASGKVTLITACTQSKEELLKSETTIPCLVFMHKHILFLFFRAFESYLIVVSC